MRVGRWLFRSCIAIAVGVGVAGVVCASDPGPSSASASTTVARDSAAPSPPPAAESHPVTDDYFGTQVVDDYRWMEAQPEPQFRAMLEKQDAYARAVIARIPARDAIAKEIDAGSGLQTVVLVVTPAGGKEFYLKRAPDQPIGRLFVRAEASGEERLLVDPAALGSAQAHATIDWFYPSQDGKLLAYGVSSGGSEASVLHVLDVATAKDQADTIDRAELAQVAWLPDNTGFLYTRSAKLPAGAPAADQFAHLRVLLHRLGHDPEGDALVLDTDKLPFDFKAKQIVPAMMTVPGSDYVLVTMGNGTSPEVAVFSAHLGDVVHGSPVWKQVAAAGDGVTQVTVHGSTAFLLTHAGAPRFRIVSENLGHPGFASARAVVAQMPGVLTGMAAASDALYFAERNGGGMSLRRLPYDANAPQSVQLPFPGTIYPPGEDAGALAANPLEPGATFSLESWLRPARWFHFDPHSNTVGDTGIVPAFARDLSGYDTIETQVRAADGAMIPLSILFKHGIALDHSHPTILEGYGSFAVSLDPSFRPSFLPWLDRGGVYAIAHVRGGGELGAPWHEGGMLANKHNTVSDFIACAEALIQLGYTASPHLAIEGASGGGIPVGVAITQRPELFGAAVLQVGATNALRFDEMKVGAALVPEYGTVKDASQFPSVLAMDALHQVKDGVAYPAVLLTGGFNDPRVPVWMPAKMAARLQAATTSHKPVLLRIEFDAGHGMGSTTAQHNAERADILAFLWSQLGG